MLTAAAPVVLYIQFISSVSIVLMCWSQACSQEDRKRDFEKIFAHYDVVSWILSALDFKKLQELFCSSVYNCIIYIILCVGAKTFWVCLCRVRQVHSRVLRWTDLSRT